MPRNGAGTFNILNPILVGTLRSSSAVNADFTDVGDQITNSMPINGIVGMSGQLKAADGSLLSPGITFGTDTNSGFRRSAADEMKWVGSGSDRATMDIDGKLSLASLNVVGAFSHTTSFGPQTLAGTGSARAVLRCTANDTAEHEMASYRSGSGSGAKGSLRMVGGGANDVQTMRFYVNDVLTFQWTGTLFTHSIDTIFGVSGIRADIDGFLDFPEITAPASPAANIARAYARDDSGVTRLYYKDNSGNERALQPPTDSQIFIASGTWTKPTQGQTIGIIEAWGGGGGGGNFGSGIGGSGGGGGSYNRRTIILASISNSVTVIVGAGGIGGTTASVSTVGGNSSFGNYLNAFAGEGGGVDAGAGGGGPLSAGITVTSTVGTNGGAPIGFLGSNLWGAGGSSTLGNPNPFGGGGGGDQADGGGALYGGGGGGGGLGFNSIGGFSAFGGGAGGGNTSGAGGAGIIYGGNGGTAATNGNPGTAPGGGGGGGVNLGGNGARGEVRIICW